MKERTSPPLRTATAGGPTLGEPSLRTRPFAPPRRRWPGLAAAGALGAAIAGAAVSSFYDGRSLGQRIDAGLSGAEAAADQARDHAADVAVGAAAAADDLRESVQDANITAAVKAALAADPALSALQIEVSTNNGIVRLRGPAPDGKARERAAVLAAAPSGAVAVDNQLVLTP